MPAHSRPTIRILAEFRPRSACTSFARCTADALPAILAGTASPTHSPPVCSPSSRNSSPRNPPCLVRLPPAPGTPRCIPDPPRRPGDRSPTHIARVSCPHEEPSAHFSSLRCLTSCTPLLVFAGQTFRRPLSDAHVIVPPPPSPRASPPFSPRPKVNSPPHPLSTQIPSSS